MLHCVWGVPIEGAMHISAQAGGLPAVGTSPSVALGRLLQVLGSA